MAIAVSQDGRVQVGTLSMLRGLVDDIAAEDLDRFPTQALGEDLIELRRQVDRLEAEFSRRLRRFDRLRGHLADGALSVVAWLRHHCRLSGVGAFQRASVAQLLGELPGAEELFAAGEIGYRHAVVLSRIVAEVGPAAARTVSDVLLRAARDCGPDELRRVSRHLRHCIDPDGSREEADAAHERRRVQLSTGMDNVWFLDGELDAEGGAILRTALDALSKPMPEEVRTAPQRRADALVELARRQLERGELPIVRGQRPQLTLTASVDTLAGRSGSPAGELSWNLTIPAPAVQRVACDAAITEISVVGGGEPLDVGRSRRTIPPAIRRALGIRDRGCRFPGCDRPSEWTDAHHLVEWSQHGTTSLDNLVLLCRVHHRHVHEGGWKLQLEGASAVVAIPP